MQLAHNLQARNRIVLLLALLSLLLMQACGEQPGDGGAGGDGGSVDVSGDPVLLPGDAREIVEDLHERSDKANASLDTALQDSIETSPARDIDDAVFKQLKATGKTSISGPGDLQDVVTYVPRQTEFPSRFLAYVTTSGGDNSTESLSKYLWLYEKKSADEPWKIAMYVPLPRNFEAPKVAVDGDGFAEMVSEDDSGELKVPPSDLPRELADYLSAYATGSQSTIFAPGSHTTQTQQRIKSLVDTQSQQGINFSVEIQPSEFPVQAFKTEDGGALTLFAYNVANRFGAAPGKTLRSTRGSEGLLAPGSYATIQRNTVSMLAAVVPPATSDDQVRIVGSAGGTVSFEGS